MSTSLYEILEIESSATETEIKKAYRKLALRYHPDKVSEDERESAEVKFKEITHAYEILSDETKRGEYDMYGSTDGVGGSYNDYSFHGNPFDNFYGNSNEYGADDFYNFFQGMNGGGHYERSNAKPRTEDAEINVDVTLEDLFKGKTIRTTSTRNIICKSCKGTGAKPSAVSKTCTACEGAGKIHKIQRLGPGMVTQKLVECTTCKGSGKIYRPKDKCKKCQGEIVVEETKILEFEIKKGSKSGGAIVLKGESDEYPGKETGDVRLTFTCKDHPVFERKGDDLYSKFKIPLADALCGFSKVVVKHLDGRSVRVTTPKGKVIRPGDFIKIKQEGMPVCSDNKSWFSSGSKRGDLYIEIDIEFPQDNWYLEKNDIFTMKNLLPNTLRNKADLKKQEVDQESSPEENIDEFTDFVISTRNALPNYDKETPQEQDHYDHHQNGYGAAQPECTQQ